MNLMKLTENRQKFEKMDTQIIAVIILKRWTVWFYHIEICPRDAEVKANNAYPGQTATTQSAQICLSDH